MQLLGARWLSAAWTGRVVVIAGVLRGRIEAAAFDPASRRWHLITPSLPAGHPARYVAMVATPHRLLLWSVWDRVTTYKHGLSDRAGVDVLSVGRDGAWHVVTGQWPQNEDVAAPTFTGSAMLLSPGTVWCGTRCMQPYISLPGHFVNPATLARTTIPPGPLGETRPAFVWTSRAIIAVDQYADTGQPGQRGSIREDDMALYNPTTSL